MTPPSAARRDALILTVAGLITFAALGTGAIAVEHRRLLTQSGLEGEYRPGADWKVPPQFTTIDNGLSAALVHQRSREHGGSAFTITWRGYLLVPKRDRYRLAMLGDDRVWLEVDKRAVIEAGDTWREASLELGRGLHPITIRYYDGGGQQAFDLQWAQGDHTHVEIPRLFLIPTLASADEVRRRVQIHGLSSWTPIGWSIVLIGTVTALVLAACTSDRRSKRRNPIDMILIYLAATIVFIAGISWGVPDFRGWAADEIAPWQVQDIVQSRFSGGWATTYPPFHFGVLALASAPVYAAVRMGLADPGLETYGRLYLVGRFVSVGMALGILALVYRLTTDEFGPRSGRFAVVLTSVMLPLTYYAKTANLDVPYLFWVTASWMFYLRAIRSGARSNYYFFAVAAAAAVATKDQAYGFYVLPAAHMIVSGLVRWRRSESSPGAPTPRTLLAMGVIFGATLAMLFNVPFNWSGVREHVRLIVGPGSQPYRMYASTAGGYARLLQDSVRQLGSVMSWPLFVFGVCGLVDAFRRSTLSVRWLMLSASSYYLTFIAVVMYQYDRFFLGICIVLAIAASAWLDRWTESARPYHRVRLGIVGAAVVYAALRVAAVDGMMIGDSRYYVERWLVARMGPDTRISTEGPDLYMPRQSQLLWTRIEPDVDVLEERKPDFLVINADYALRRSPEMIRNPFYRALDEGATPYRRVLRHQTTFAWSPLRWEHGFNGPEADPFSNLTKINPVIDVFERIAPPKSRN